MPGLRKGAHGGRDFQGSVHTKLGHLRSAMTFAERSKIIEAVPYIERPSKPTPKERYLTKDEVQKLIDHAEAPHIALAIHLLFATAGRVGAVLGLTWERVNMEQYLGHSNTAITFSTYGRFAPDHLTEAAEVLDFVKLRAKG